MSLKSKVESLISAGNETTGQSKTDLTSVVQDLVDGYGQGGGGVTVEPLSVTENRTYTAPSGKAYSPISVNVPNTYSASDEGKVVDNGALVAQTSDTVTANDTYDTTLINSLTVNVSGGGGSMDYFDYTQPTGALTTSLTTIYPYALYKRTGVTSVTANSATILKTYAFSECTALTSVSATSATLEAHAFHGCTALTSVSLSSAMTSIPDSAFYNCKSLATANFSNVTSIAANAYNGCTSLTTADFPNVTTLANGSFRTCSALTNTNFPKLKTGNSNTFTSCTSLQCIVLPAFTGVINSDFLSYCSNLTTVDLGSPSSIQQNSLRNSAKLATLIIRKTSVCTLSATGALANTPFASGKTGGTLYVPQSLISTYQTSSNWSTILGYPNNSIQAIEGSYYETHYADGTTIPTS